MVVSTVFTLMYMVHVQFLPVLPMFIFFVILPGMKVMITNS